MREITPRDLPADAKHDSARQNSVTFFLLCSVYFVEGADMQLLPSTFRALEAHIGLSPSGLALLGMCQAIACCGSAPVWGVMVDAGWSSKWLLVGGSSAWALLTFLLSFVTNFHGMIVLRCLNGLALATLTPVSQAVIARMTERGERGAAFGFCGCAQLMGAVVCSLFATAISNQTILGHEGWRIAFIMVAFASLLLSVQLATCLHDTRTQAWRQPNVFEEFQDFFGYCRIPTFMVIVLQGCAGAAPWSAMSFMVMFFQYIGMTDKQAALLSGVSMFSQAIGHLIGGYVGDYLTAWSRFHGRPLAAQISVSAGTVLMLVLFVGVPQDPGNFMTYLMIQVCFGLTASWCYVGINRPILLEVVAEGSQARVLAWESALEGSSSACLGAPLVGFLATEMFGYVPQSLRMSEIPEDIRDHNADALASGMLWMTLLPWAVCFIIFSTLHYTYKRDVERSQSLGESSKLVD